MQCIALMVELAMPLSMVSPGAYRLAMFILSADGQRILARHGFSAPVLPKEGS